MATDRELYDAGQISAEEFMNRLEADNIRQKAKIDSGVHRLSLKVSEKGALSIYGLGKFPVTHYKETWFKILGMANEIVEFIAANDSALKSKQDHLDAVAAAAAAAPAVAKTVAS